ncbi:MAG: hypothetical protein RL033_4973 [Pseudomonadota bacterium]
MLVWNQGAGWAVASALSIGMMGGCGKATSGSTDRACQAAEEQCAQQGPASQQAAAPSQPPSVQEPAQPPSPSVPRECALRGFATQADIDALEGCAVLLGDLVVSLPNADLRPLHALTRITGTMSLGAPEVARPSFTLEGLEQLESIGLIATMDGLSITSLAPLRSLRSVTELYLTRLPNLINLQGLERLELDDIMLEVYDAPRLQSLRPLVFPARMNHRLHLRQVPSLIDLGDISRLQSIEDLELNQTGLTHLDELVSLRSALILQLVNNPLLQEVSALSSLESTELFTFYGNPQLLQLPAFPVLSGVGNLTIEDNERLESIGSYPLLTWMVGGWNGELKVRNNASLQQIDGLAGLEQTDRVVIQANAKLRSIALPGLRSVTQSLVVTSNPELDPGAATALAGVRATVAKLVGNDGGPTLRDPCPWLEDTICDAPPYDTLCAEGSDAVDCPIPL